MNKPEQLRFTDRIDSQRIITKQTELPGMNGFRSRVDEILGNYEAEKDGHSHHEIKVWQRGILTLLNDGKHQRDALKELLRELIASHQDADSLFPQNYFHLKWKNFMSAEIFSAMMDVTDPKDGEIVQSWNYFFEISKNRFDIIDGFAAISANASLDFTRSKGLFEAQMRKFARLEDQAA